MAASSLLSSFGTRPAILRRVSEHSLILTGHLVEILPSSHNGSGLVNVRTRWGGRYEMPREFLLMPDASEEPLQVLEKPKERPYTKRAGKESSPEPVTPVVASSEATDEVQVPEAAQVLTPKVSTPTSSRPLTPDQMTRAQRSAWRQSLPRLEDTPAPPASRIVGGELRTIDDEEFIVARDGTYRPASTDAYKGALAIAARAVVGKHFSRGTIEETPGMITVTIIHPPKHEERSIRADVMRALIAASTDADFDSVAQKRRARQAEKRLADRVRALRNVGTRTADDREVRERVGVQVREIRSV